MYFPDMTSRSAATLSRKDDGAQNEHTEREKLPDFPGKDDEIFSEMENSLPAMSLSYRDPHQKHPAYNKWPSIHEL